MAPGTVIDEYYVGQGEASLFLRDSAGKRFGGRLIGNCNDIRIRGQQQEVSHIENRTGKRLKDNKIVWQPTTTISITFDNFSKENLAWLFDGTATVKPSGSATAEVQKYAPIMQLDNFGVSAVTAKKTGAGSNWAGGTFSVTPSGLVTILTDPPVAGVAPDDLIEFAYSYSAFEEVSAFAGVNREYWFSTHAINKAQNDEPKLLDVFKIKFMQDYEYSLIGEDYGTLTVQGEVLYDSLNASSGGYFRDRALVNA
jgi:hypothetical protein